MKKIISVVSALAVTTSAFSPIALAADTKYGVSDTVTNSNVPLEIQSSYDMWTTEDYSTHTEKNPMIADVKAGDSIVTFSSKAILDMTDVAKEWDKYLAAAKSYGVSDATIKNNADENMTGDFTITVKADSKISKSEKFDIVEDANVDKLFTAAEPKMNGNEFTVTYSLKKGSYDNLTAYFKTASENPLTVTIANNNVTGTDIQSVSAELKGTLTLATAAATFTFNYGSTKATDYVQLKVPAKVTKPTPKPTAVPTPEPTQAPTAAPGSTPTPVPTAAPTATPTPEPIEEVVIGDLVKEASGGDYSDIIGDGSLDSFIVKVDDDKASYGEDYAANITVGNKSYSLTENDYNMIVTNQYTEIQDEELRKAILNDSAFVTSYDVETNTYETSTDTVKKMSNAVKLSVLKSDKNISVVPVYKVSEGFVSLEGLGGNVDVVASTEAPTEAPTRRPSSGGGGGSSTVPVKFNTNGGSEIKNLNVNRNTAIGQLPTPSREGYVFAGWYADEALTIPYTGTEIVKASTTLYAKWDSAPIVTTAPADGPALNYTDHFAYVVGYEDGTVRPTNNITRAEVATIIFRLFTDETRAKYMTTENSFSDVNANDWYNDAVSTVAKAGIVDGYEDGTFAPNANITRAEFATIASRFATGEYSSIVDFTDIAGHWAAENIKKAAALGWVTGYEDNTFAPDKKITRAEAMTIINRLTYRNVDADGISSDAVKWPDNDESAWYYAAVEEATNSHTYTRTELGAKETWSGLISEATEEDTETPVEEGTEAETEAEAEAETEVVEETEAEAETETVDEK